MTVQMVPHIPENAPFSPEQRAWLNGFMAGLFSRTEAQAQAVPAAASAVLQPLTVLYGSQTGNAETLAKKFAKLAGKRGFAATMYDMAEYPVENLKSERNLVVITSTYGDGEPPDPAKPFWDGITSLDSVSLKNTNYSVLALGDTNYEKFCQFGIDVDNRLEKLGAHRIHNRIECDVDYDESFEAWCDGVLPALQENAAPSATAPADVIELPKNGKSHSEEIEGPLYSRKNPFQSTLLTVRRLNAEGSEKDTRHVEFSLEGSGLAYEVGDALGVVPENSPDEVDRIIELLHFNPEHEVPLPKGGNSSIKEALQYHYDISAVGKPFLKWVAERSKNEHLSALMEPDRKEDLDRYMWGRELYDVFAENTNARFSVEEMVENLKPLQPRLYSISSSPNAFPGQVHATVGVVKYDACGRRHYGVCSGFLSRIAQVGSKIPVYINVTKSFRMPSNGDAPIIMVGPGTGIAPFRAFLQERKISGASGKNWLFFGNPYQGSDFLYCEELSSMLDEGVLTRLDTAFSRDQEQKVYVQHRLVERAAELYAWLEEGAYFYVCGDAKRMAKDVHQALIEVVQSAGGKSHDEAQEYIAEMQKQKRYQRDVY